MNQLEIGKFLAQLRKEKNLSQKELSQKIGVQDKTISKWENGNYMPSIDMLLILSDFYGLSVNEILCARKNFNNDVTLNNSEENIRYIVKENKKQFKNYLILGTTIISCLIFLFVSTMSILFINSRKNSLYPISLQDHKIDKIVKGNYEILNTQSGNTVYENDLENIELSFSLPSGYNKQQEGLYLKDSCFIKITTCKEIDFAYPMNLAISQYFSSSNISRYIDKINFVFKYNLEDTNIFSSENKIEFAGGCRILKGFTSLANENKNKGVYYSIVGDYKGYIQSSQNEDNMGIVWNICLQNDLDLYFITIKDNNILNINNIKEFISSIEF